MPNPKGNIANFSKHWIGEQNANAKLTEKKVKRIRDIRNRGELTYAEIGAAYDVSWRTIRAICKRWRWKHI